MLVSDKIGFKSETLTRDKENPYSNKIHLTIIYALNKRTLKL